METRTYYDDYLWLQITFKNYTVICSGSTKTTEYTNYKTNQEKNINSDSSLSMRKKEIKISEINENKSLYGGGVILLVSNKITKYVTQKYIVPDNRRVSIEIKEVFDDIATLLHFVYTLAKQDEKTVFWEKFANNNKVVKKYRQIIIEDLNAHLSHSDSNSGNVNIPGGLEKIIYNNALVDVYRHKHPELQDEKCYTFHRIKNNQTVASRVDYCLTPVDFLSKSQSVLLKISIDNYRLTTTSLLLVSPFICVKLTII